MGTLTIIGIATSAIGAGLFGISGVCLSIDAAHKVSTKFMEAYTKELDKNIEKNIEKKK